MNAQHNDRKLRVTGQDIALAYLAKGIEGVTRLRDTKGLSVTALESASEALREQEDHDGAATLDAMREDLFPAGDGVRGRSAPTVGMSRSYNVQIDGNGGLFLKVPCATLGVSRHQPVRVNFLNGEIILTVS